MQFSFLWTLIAFTLITILYQQHAFAQPQFSDVSLKQEVCKVIDPTENKLDLRNIPYGTVTRSVSHGTRVMIEQSQFDFKGQAWVKVGTLTQGGLGWISREFIRCE